MMPNKNHFNASDYAREIFQRHTNAYMQGVYAEYRTNSDFMDDAYNECAFILTSDLLEGKLSPMQFAAVRNELGKLIWDIFEPYVTAEEDAKAEEWRKVFA